MFSLYTDAELATLSAQIKAAIPKVLRGQRVRIGDSEYDRTTLESLKAFGDGLAREISRRQGTASRITTLVPRRSPGPRGLF